MISIPLFCKLLNETAVDELLFFSLLTVDESVVYKIPTIAKMRALYDNYELDSSVRENVTPDEVLEEKEFVNEILDTQVMQTAMKFLNRKGDANSTISLKRNSVENRVLNVIYDFQAWLVRIVIANLTC